MLRRIRASYADTCAGCGRTTAARREIMWDDASRKVWHPSCAPAVQPARQMAPRAQVTEIRPAARPAPARGPYIEEIVETRTVRRTIYR